MNTDTFDPAEDRVGAAVAEYLEARDSGHPLSVADWLARYPDLAAELREFLDDGAAAGLRVFRGRVREPDLTTDERVLGEYELLERIGGNMGTVYRARQLNLPREVAVKVLLRAGTGDRARFRTEAEAMARLRHPNIVRILEVSRGGGTPFFTMDWYPGGTLADRAEFARQPRRAAVVVEKIAGAVHHAHRHGLLHRDLKPANVLLDDKGEPVVADFGLAVPLDRTAETDRRVAGTPAYMAPEQLNGEFTVATDVFGVGAILYELLTGRPPAYGPTLAVVLDRVRLAAPVPPDQLNPRIDPDLSAICMKCLAKEPGDRYATAADIAADLERFRLALPPLARPLGPLGRASRLLREARAAGDFRALAPGLVGQAALVLGTNVGVFALLCAGASEVWVWVALFTPNVSLFVLLARERWCARERYNPARFHLWSIWVGQTTACAAVMIGSRLAAGADLSRGIEAGYIGGAGLNALAFVVMGSLFAGRQYLLGLAWAGTAVVMGVFPYAAPLIYAGLIAACCLLTGFQLSALREDRA
ncbi:Serine/threonine-protein kinase PknB [Gemmata sp. SH-PL17]|uniref:serine/threonine-protein kinase n=1 Tax=Gemmata sp. SH-PL17 TaxID=1630693 RepID=UPI00078E8B99|nr:serine/threonine-protein kinase [Gemmata sp. SH-PL17]AMV25720.1 Serine/threonine-protein kinase PknB [Gemmata sp. SH-PL17]